MRELAVMQLVSIVEWVSEERTLITDSTDQNERYVLEVGPGSVLRGLWRALLKEMRKKNSDNKQDEILPECLPAGKLEEIENINIRS